MQECSEHAEIKARQGRDVTAARTTPVLVAPDSFKGTFTAAEVGAAIARGLRAAGMQVDLCPVADGGEGTVAVLGPALGAGMRTVAVSDPLGRPLSVSFALAREVAIIEMAAASGLALVGARERDAVGASTAGTGELIVAALHAGARTIQLGVGGSATTDGGAGAVAAIERAGGLRDARLIVLCDVHTPFEQAAEVFAPQKGASAADIAVLTQRLETLASALPQDPRGVPMTGAAGGLSGGLWAAFGAELVAGASFVLDAIGFNARAAGARAVITGEGRLDQQSLAGKLVSEVAARARRAGTPCHAVVGTRALDRAGLQELGLGEVVEASTLEALEDAGRRLAEII
jgi:glycerate kinase